MEIKNLPPKLKELALERMKENRSDCSSLGGAFTWSKTPEGGDFWNNINCGKIPSEYLDTVINNYEIF